MIKSIFEILKFNTVLHKLYEQRIDFTINIAYKIHKLIEELNEIETLIFERWEILFGQDYDINNFNEEQIELYNLTLKSEIEINFYGLKPEDIFENKKAMLSIQDIEVINDFFKTI